MATEPRSPAAASGDAGAVGARRVAIVVVHGVADQKPGATAQSVVDLLTSASPPDVEYTATMSRDFAIHVDPMNPHPRHAFDGPPPARRHLVAAGPGRQTPTSEHRHWTKSLMQSLQSDFQRGPDESEEPVDLRWCAARAKSRLKATFARPLASGSRPEETRVDDEPSRDARSDRGLEFTSYLLTKALRNGAPAEDFATRKTRLYRKHGDRRMQVDVHEMYWADLSRLSGAIPTIITELLTMIFRLSRLGSDTVAEASRYASGNRAKRERRWAALSFFQTLLDWSFTNILAQLFAQLFLVGVLAMLIGLAAPWTTPDAVQGSSIHGYLRGIGALLVVVPVAAAFYFSRAGARLLPIAVAGVVAIAGSAMVFAPDVSWAFTLTATALISVAYRGILRTADERFPFVLQSGSVLWAGLVGWMATHAALYDGAGGDSWTRALHGALAGFELLLLFIKWWWICAAVVIVVWAMLSISTEHQSYDRRASAATGRLGVFVAFAVFVTTTMALWAVLEKPVEKAVGTMRYDPVLWTTQPALSPDAMRARVAVDPGFCYADHIAQPFASDFLACRFDASTQMFSSVAILLVAVLGYLVLTVLPSVLAELSWTHSMRPGATERLGLWLTALYRRLDLFVLVCTIVGVVALVAFALYVGSGHSGDRFIVGVTRYSHDALRYIVFPATTAFAILSAFGRFLSRTLPGVRAPLDAALDVDNYFREFPRRQIPRARIFSRYRALMRRIRDQGYDRIVVVSHSQGTVISAEFLRFISSHSTENVRYDRRPRMRELMGCDVRLLTLGCPLRQLYATRFPTYYQWIIDQTGEVNGPLASDIGVEVWANAFGSGDYVGRWLWSSAVTPPDGFHPLADGVVHDSNFKRRTIYQPFRPIPLPEGLLSSYKTYETCTGFGAHTHYFDLPKSAEHEDRSIVAFLVDRLVADDYAEPPPAPAA